MSEWQHNLVEILTHDHRDMENLFTQLEAAIGPQRKADLVGQVTLKLMRHSVAEEQWLYPTIRNTLADGRERADRAIAEHANIQLTLQNLACMRPGERGYSRRVTSLISDVRTHTRDEEQHLFPQLIAATTPTKRHKPAHNAGTTKKTAPGG